METESTGSFKQVDLTVDTNLIPTTQGRATLLAAATLRKPSEFQILIFSTKIR